ncbi:VOC family protein [Mesobacillus zeae]|uniref:Glyoxalase/bleomycin resistance/dioxygenase family protein n=1 Tax=Mesobacillus zeae TaxID=1917180 RepID=A0A398BE49_9BACI|nr:VOC family protein [Mesobacillus zeae]RID85856.1 glyoxalase/bleomycin resistance/dioxygenase family protein [Mesobacillus zeae]
MKFHHFALEVLDLEKTKKFYKEVLGFSDNSCIDFMGEEVLFLKNGETKIELLKRTKGPGISSNAHFCFEADGMNKLLKQFKKYGYHPIEGPYQLKNGWTTVFFEGPEQEILEFIELPK